MPDPTPHQRILRKGKGDHRDYDKSDQRFVITVDMGAREIPVATIREDIEW